MMLSTIKFIKYYWSLQKVYYLKGYGMCGYFFLFKAKGWRFSDKKKIKYGKMLLLLYFNLLFCFLFLFFSIKYFLFGIILIIFQINTSENLPLLVLMYIRRISLFHLSALQPTPVIILLMFQYQLTYINILIDWCLTPTLAVFQLYCDVKYIKFQ